MLSGAVGEVRAPVGPRAGEWIRVPRRSDERPSSELLEERCRRFLAETSAGWEAKETGADLRGLDRQLCINLTHPVSRLLDRNRACTMPK